MTYLKLSLLLKNKGSETSSKYQCFGITFGTREKGIGKVGSGNPFVKTGRASRAGDGADAKWFRQVTKGPSFYFFGLVLIIIFI